MSKLKVLYRCWDCNGYFVDDESLQSTMEYVTEVLEFVEVYKYLCPECVEKLEKASREVEL